MSTLRTILLSCLLFVAAGIATAAEPEFPLKNGDIWVMAGDSITAQHLHSNYFEAFCFARYPELKFAFRNSGVGGHTIPSTLARFEYDVAAWKPTVVSVELGMNDKGGTPTDKFLQNMKTMVDRIRSTGSSPGVPGARPVILAASPVNNGETLAKLGGGNQRLNEYATQLITFCDQEKVPYADQFHALIDVWGNNKPREQLANSLSSLKQLASDDRLAGVEHLRKFLAEQAKDPNPPVSMHGDAVHPGPTGQLMMAAALLRALGAAKFVSSATIDSTGKLVDSKGCKIEELAPAGGGVTFTRLDERLPFPIPDDARNIVAFDPTILDMSQYLLTVKGLKAGEYQVKINGVASGTVTAEQLAAGVNLTNLSGEPSEVMANPINAKSRAILAAVNAKEGVVGTWRGLSQRAHAGGGDPKLKEELAELTKKVEEADAKIREAATPQKLKFEIVAQ